MNMILLLVFLLVIMVCLLFLGSGLFMGKISEFLIAVLHAAGLSEPHVVAVGAVGTVVVVAFWLAPEFGLIALVGAIVTGLLYVLYRLLRLFQRRRS